MHLQLSSHVVVISHGQGEERPSSLNNIITVSQTVLILLLSKLVGLKIQKKEEETLLQSKGCLILCNSSCVTCEITQILYFFLTKLEEIYFSTNLNIFGIHSGVGVFFREKYHTVDVEVRMTELCDIFL